MSSPPLSFQLLTPKVSSGRKLADQSSSTLKNGMSKNNSWQQQMTTASTTTIAIIPAKDEFDEPVSWGSLFYESNSSDVAGI
jgi:hypothetical protein